MPIAQLVAGGWLALQLSDSIDAVFYVMALAMLVYGLLIALAAWRRSWFKAAIKSPRLAR